MTKTKSTLKNGLSLFLVSFVFAFLLINGVSASLIAPTSAPPNSFASTNLSSAYNELTGEWFNVNYNTTQTFVNSSQTILWVPLYNADNVCSVSALQTTNCNIGSLNMTTNCMVSDQFSQVGLGLSLSNDSLHFDEWFNTLNITNSSYGTLQSWDMYRNGTALVTSNALVNSNGNSASDADARNIIALYNSAGNTNFNSANRSKYLTLANQMSKDFVKYDLVNSPQTTNFGTVNYFLASGAVQAVSGLGSSSFGYTGYFGDAIKAMLETCSNTQNKTYCSIANDLSLNYLQASNFNGVSFTTPQGLSWHWTNLGGLISTSCDNTCSPVEWDSADAPRAFTLGADLYYSNQIGYSLNSNLNTYMNIWANSYMQNSNSVVLQYYPNGLGAATAQSGYFAQGLQSLGLVGVNTTLYNSTLYNALAHYSSTPQSMDYSACFGVYGQSQVINSLATGIGLDSNDYPHLGMVSAQLHVTPISPLTNITTQNSSINIQYNLSCDTGLNCTTNYTFNGNSFIYDPILEYQFNNFSSLGEFANGTDCNITDVSGHGNTGVCVGGANVSINPTGGVNNMGAVNFSGNTNYVNASNPTRLQFVNSTNDWTISFWLYANDNLSRIAFYKPNAWRITYNANFVHQLLFLESGGSGPATISSLNALQLNTWQYITITHNSSNNFVFFVNAKNYTTSGSANTFSGVQGDLTIGGRLGTSNTNGSIGDVVIFNRSLSSNDVLQLYNSYKKQFNTQNSTFYSTNYINTTLLNSSVSSAVYQYQNCIINSSLNSVCLAQQITRIPKISQLIYSSTILRLLNQNTYGTSIAGSFRWFTQNGANISQNSGSQTVLPLASNYTWHQQEFLNSKMNIFRQDMELGQLYSNTSDVNGVNMTGNFSTYQAQLQWAKNNNIKIMYEIDFMPSWLADNSSGYCSDLTRCIPSNYTKFNNIVLDFINQITQGDVNLQNNLLLEFWNEPDGSFFLGGLTTFNVTKIPYYITFYNNTYNGIKAVYPNIPFGGPTLSSTGPLNVQFMNSWLGNTTGKRDFISWHDYINSYSTAIPWVIGNCSGTCNNIFISETNPTTNATITNSSQYQSYYSNLLAQNYINGLNYPNINLTLFIHLWSVRYLFNNSNYPDYPKIYSMVSEPQLDNAIYPPYNITYKFTHYASANSNVLISSINDSTDGLITSSPIQGVCTDSGGLSCILVNTDTEGRNVTNPFTQTMIRVGDGQLFTAGQNLGIMDSYDVDSYTPAYAGVFYNSSNSSASQTYIQDYLGNNIISTSNITFNQYSNSFNITNTLATPIGGVIYNYPVRSCNITSITDQYGNPQVFTCNSLTNQTTINIKAQLGINAFYVNFYQTYVNSVGFCSNVTSGFGGFYGQIGTILAVVALLVIVTVILFVVYAVKNPEADVGEMLPESLRGLALPLVFGGILGIALLIYLITILFGILCS